MNVLKWTHYYHHPEANSYLHKSHSAADISMGLSKLIYNHVHGCVHSLSQYVLAAAQGSRSWGESQEEGSSFHLAVEVYGQ